MYFTNKQFIETITSTGVSTNQIVDYLKIVSLLIKKYWRIIYSTQFLETIKNNFIEVYNIINILKKTNKHSLLSIKKLISILKKNTDYKENFQIEIQENENYEKVKNYINSKFESSSVEQKSAENISIKISWEWWYYKRNLDQDIEKLISK